MSDTDTDTEDRPRNRDGGRRNKISRRDSIRDRSIDHGPELRSMKSSSNRVYVSNIPYEYRWQDVKDLFRNEVGDVQFVELFFDDHDKPKGSGIVEFSDSASVLKCVEIMQRYEVKGRKLVIKEDSGVMRDRHGSVISGGARRGDRFRGQRDHGSKVSLRHDEGKWNNTYGLSVQFLESLKIDPPIGNKVFVANLAFNVDKKIIKDAFKLAGKIVAVEIPVDKDGRSRGFAIVEYDHPVEAVQAISMFHNQVYFDRTITVRMDRAGDSLRLPEGLRSVGMGLGPNGEPLKCVAHNLPSLTNSQKTSSVGSGMLGSVPNNLQLTANALSGLNAVRTLGGINPQVLQAANLSGFANNILSQGLGNSNLTSLANNATQQLAVLSSQNQNANLSSGNSVSNYGRRGAGGNQTANNNDRGFQNNSNYSNSLQFNNSSLSSGNDFQDTKHFSRKIIVSNLPSTVNYKLLSDKLAQYGDIVSFEAKSAGSVILTYESNWQAERAIENLDQSRIDGRIIEARLYH